VKPGVFFKLFLKLIIKKNESKPWKVNTFKKTLYGQ
jgi:hypothetical protein